MKDSDIHNALSWMSLSEKVMTQMKDDAIAPIDPTSLPQPTTACCPHIVTSSEGTSYCNLAEDSVRRLERELKEWKRRRKESDDIAIGWEHRSDKLYAENTYLKEVLNEIASWYEGAEVTNSFDEPAAAKTAREALRSINEKETNGREGK